MPIELLRHRLVFVTGKGGVGKSTFALALGTLAARRGMRTIVAEIGAQRLARTFSRTSESFAEVELRPDLFTIAIDPEHAMEEYLRVKTGTVGHALGQSRLFQAFAMATPGMRELLTIGKAWELAQTQRRTDDALPYELVVVDAPASGHGVGLLRTPRTFAEIAKVGPIAHQGRAIAETIADPAFTAVVAVATPEEMPVNETIALAETLGRDRLGLAAVVLNARYGERFDQEELPLLEGALASVTAPRGRAALRAALSERARAGAQAAQEARVLEHFEGRLLRLPFLFCPRLGPEEIEALADELQEQVL
jgi:anion-transporting  ArsA/GET3 family ATPase